MEKQYYSQYGQDAFLEKIFKKKLGTFLDIGAYDGITFSNTYFLESSLNWKGICVEPNPIPFSKLKEVRKSINVNCGIGTANKQLKFLALSGAGEMLSGFTSTFNDEHYARITEMERHYEIKKQNIAIEAKPLSELLNDYNIKNVDYCSIDVEGGEMEVLKSIDFDAVNIRLISVENNLGTKDAKKFLRALGYSRIWKIGSDEFYERETKRYGLILKFKFQNFLKRLSYLKNQIFS